MKSALEGGRVRGERAAGVQGEAHARMNIRTCIYTNNPHTPKKHLPVLLGRYILQYAEKKGSRMFYETGVWYGETINGLKGRLTKKSPYASTCACMHACMFYVSMYVNVQRLYITS